MTKLLMAMLFFLSMSSTETYYITFVKGNVKLARTGKTPVIGEKITAEDKLVFIDKNAKISCVSPSKGRFDITSSSAKEEKKGEWIAVISSSLLPASGKYQLSTRAISAMENDPGTFFKTSGTDNRVLIIENEWIPVNHAYAINEKNFFFLQYAMNGKTVLKKLSVNSNAIAFSQSSFTNEKGMAVPADSCGTVSLCYQENVNGKPTSKVIAKFIAVLITKEQLAAEAGVLKKNLEQARDDKAVIKKELYAHFAEHYGKLNPDYFDKFFADHIVK